tara:strand:+ start:396 stop:1199 length:804 start_codon:yes stop_codon:yes gene_type:complete
MKILSWNVAGLRAMINKKTNLVDLLKDANYDIVCLQETKCEEKQIELPSEITETYLFRYWNSTKGTTQRKGLSGTTIWSKTKPLKELETQDFDEEGRITALEYKNFILVNVYTPNSQNKESERYKFRQNWDDRFEEYITKLKLEVKKNIIICGDLNVAHLEIDVSNPKSKKDKVAGFFDFERTNYAYLIENNTLVDVYRKLNSIKNKSTYWSNFSKQKRRNDNGWGIDYFVVSSELLDNEAMVKCDILIDILGSDHCPISLELSDIL